MVGLPPHRASNCVPSSSAVDFAPVAGKLDGEFALGVREVEVPH